MTATMSKPTYSRPFISLQSFISDFASRTLPLAWRGVDRGEFAEQLRERLDNPALLRQSEPCWPAATLSELLASDPIAYVRFAIELVEDGRARLGSLSIEPDHRLLTAPIPEGAAAADWVPMAAIRNSENGLRSYTRPLYSAVEVTRPDDMERWVRAQGFTEVIRKTDRLYDIDWPTAAEASELFNEGYQVFLFINSELIHGHKPGRKMLSPDHWVTFSMGIESPDAAEVELAVFSWGFGESSIPHGAPLTRGEFVDHFFGFIAARY